MVSIQPFIKSFVVNFTPSAEYDVEYYKIHAVHSDDFENGTFTPSESNLISQGPDTAFLYDVPKGGVWGLKIGAVDTFGEDLLNYSQLYTVNVPTLDPLDQVPPNVPTFIPLPVEEVETGIESSGPVDNVFVKVAWELEPVPEDFLHFTLAYKKSTDTDWNELTTTEYSYKFTGLVAGVSYQFKLRAVDQWNNASAWSELKTIAAAKDSIAPAVPSGLAVTAGMKKIIVSFTANTEPDLAGYEVHASITNNFPPSTSTLIAKGLDTLYSYEGLVDTTYYVKLRAYDHSGNYSGYSAQASAKTMFVVTQDLVDDIITTAKLANDSVTSEILAANAVTSTEIADNAITSPKILAEAIIAGKIATDAVTANTIAANAVTAGKISVGAVTAGTIAANAVTATTIQAGAVTSDKVTSGELLTLSAQIKDAIITDAKITSLNASKITTGTLSASTSISVGDSKIKLDGVNSRISVTNNAGTITDMVLVGNLATGNYGLSVKDKSGLQVFRVDENGAVLQNLTAGTIDANKVTINNLVVGSNVTMGPNAYISWANVTSQPTIPTNTNQLTDGAGLGTTASWSNVAGRPNTTYIDANGIYTGTLTANQINTSGFTAQSTNIGTAAITEAKIADAAITTAKIGAAQVDTLQIAGDAVVLPTVIQAADTFGRVGTFDYACEYLYTLTGDTLGKTHIFMLSGKVQAADALYATDMSLELYIETPSAQLHNMGGCCISPANRQAVVGSHWHLVSVFTVNFLSMFGSNAGPYKLKISRGSQPSCTSDWLDVQLTMLVAKR